MHVPRSCSPSRKLQLKHEVFCVSQIKLSAVADVDWCCHDPRLHCPVCGEIVKQLFFLRVLLCQAKLKKIAQCYYVKVVITNPKLFVILYSVIGWALLHM